jgi:hypothetical protein
MDLLGVNAVPRRNGERSALFPLVTALVSVDRYHHSRSPVAPFRCLATPPRVPQRGARCGIPETCPSGEDMHLFFCVE